jgi:LytR cell envelope-related transcriptional attenuator
MTSEPPYSDGGSAENGGGGSRGRPSAGIAPVRAAVVLIVFIVASIALVAIGTRGTPSGSAATNPTTTTTTTPGKTVPTTTTTTVPHSAVTVVVANATTTSGLAGHYTTVLAAQGWAMQTAADATTNEVTSTVYYQAGQQGPAEQIATTLGLKPAAVQPYTAAVPVPGTTTIDVVVVIGTDLVAGAG